MKDINSREYWQDRYEENNTQWDIGFPSTPIATYMDGVENKALKILIPGCGNAYEAKYILDRGFTNLTLMDIAAQPLAMLREALKSYGKNVNIIEGDFFELTDQFDLIIEQTFFCALMPEKRVAYVQKMQELLRHNGKLVGVLFNRLFEAGPPFGGSEEEYEQLFSTAFKNVKITPCYNSILPREGAEVFINIS